MDSERMKMLSGELYNASDPQLVYERVQARRLLKQLNDSESDAVEQRGQVTQHLFGSVGADVWIEPPFYCDYGWNIHLGDKVFINFNCVILDVMPVHIGNAVFVAPGVQIYTATHPLDARQRTAGLESGREIHVGDEVWIGGGSILLPGTRIGARTVIGAGSVVFGEIPAGVLVVGNPCRVVRSLE